MGWYIGTSLIVMRIHAQQIIILRGEDYLVHNIVESMLRRCGFEPALGVTYVMLIYAVTVIPNNLLRLFGITVTAYINNHVTSIYLYIYNLHGTLSLTGKSIRTHYSIHVF